MITDNEARRCAAKIRRGTDTLRERGDYDRWARATKGRRQRTPLAALLAERDVRVRAQQAASDLLARPGAAHKTDEMLRTAARVVPHPGLTERAPDDGPGFDPPMPGPNEPPIAPPLPPLDGEIVEPIAPPIDLGDPPAAPAGFDLGGGIAKAARAALEAIDAHNPEIGGLALAKVFGANFWPAWEQAAERLVAKYAGPVKLADDELVVGGAIAVVAQPIAIPYVKEHGGEWIAKIKGWFGGAS